VRARVPGYLEAIHFQDGQMVKTGGLLFTIDRRPFQIALAQAQASLAQARPRSRSRKATWRAQPRPCHRLGDHQQTFDQRTQASAARKLRSRATGCGAPAALDLEFTELRAPVSGADRRPRVSWEISSPRNVGNTSLLATIESIDPIRFDSP